MTRVLRALLEQAIDYAGLFPPAKLPLAEAIANYAEYRRGPEAWMLGRFICPAAQLEQLAAHAELFAEEPPFAFSVLGSAAAGKSDVAAAFANDLALIEAFRARHRERIRIDAFELRLPADLVRDECTAELVRLAEHLRREFAGHGLGAVAIACEAPLGGDRRQQNRVLAQGLSFANTKNQLEAGGFPAIALKLRCGGVEAAAFPSVDEVAYVLRTCVELRLPLKFTAGLHHPLRRFDDSVNTDMHGFLNVLGATVLDYAAEEPIELTEILAERSPASFAFNDERFSWRSHSGTLEQVRSARKELGLAFGSCSFDEPRDDLRGLGLI